MTPNTGGPAFPHGPLGDSIQHEDGRISHQWQGSPGMDLLDWMAGQETLAEFDNPEASYGDKLATAFAGPKPQGGWAEDPRGMFEWEAKVRAGMKYTRASAMLAEKLRREEAMQSALQKPGVATAMAVHQAFHGNLSSDAGKMAALEALNRELVWALETMISGWVDPYDDNDNVAKARAILAKAKEVA